MNLKRGKKVVLKTWKYNTSYSYSYYSSMIKMRWRTVPQSFFKCDSNIYMGFKTTQICNFLKKAAKVLEKPYTVSKGSFKTCVTRKGVRGVVEKNDKKWHGGRGVTEKMMSIAQMFFMFISPAIQFSFLWFLGLYDIVAISNKSKPKRLVPLVIPIQKVLTHFRPIFHLCRNQVVGFY